MLSWLTTSPRAIWVGPAVVAAIIGIILLVMAVTSDKHTRGEIGVVALLVLVGCVVIVTMLRIVLLVIGADADVQPLAELLSNDTQQQRLLARWMGRARWARNVGGVAGLAVFFLGTNGHGDILLFGVGGIALGAMVAELHYVRPRGGVRTATLEVRSVNDYLSDYDRRRMILVAGGAVILGVLSIVFQQGRGARSWALLALVVLLAARVVQQRVASRPRPAVTANLREADDLARELAIGRGLARPAIFFALALIAHGLVAFSPAVHGSGLLLAGVVWLYALSLWWRNRRLGLDFLFKSVRPALP